MISSEFTLNGIEEVQYLIANLESFDSKNTLEKIGNKYQSRIRKGFRSGQDPYGDSWHSISHRNGQALLDTGHLLRSIRFEVKDGLLTFGTALDYAEYHQEGLGNLHQRTFLPDERGLPEVWLTDFQEIFWKNILETIK